MESMESVNSIPRIYLVDTENIGRKTLQSLNKIRDIDKVIIFESDKSFRISFKEMLNIDQTKISVISAHNSGKNAMDFMIATTLGHLVTDNKDKIYIVVSNDTGFDEIVTFWRQQGLYVRRHSDIGVIDETLEKQVHRGKELKLKELDKLYDNKEEQVNIDEYIKHNEDILRNIMKLRSNEDATLIANIIYSSKSIEDCRGKLNDAFKYAKDNKIGAVNQHWDHFLHAN